MLSVFNAHTIKDGSAMDGRVSGNKGFYVVLLYLNTSTYDAIV